MGFEDNLTWEGNSRKMYDAVLDAVPKMFRGTVMDQVEEYVEDNEVEVVTEDLIEEAIADQAPASFKDKFLKILEPLKSK